MAEITAALVKALRDKSGVGMMDCKKALQETEGEMEAAVDWLRAKGLSKAAKKADRVAAEGVVALTTRVDGAGMTASVIELNAETDFVARNEAFQKVARSIAATALGVDGDVEAVRAARESTAASRSMRPITNLGGHHRREHAAAPFQKVCGRARARSGPMFMALWSARPISAGSGCLVAVEGEGDQAVLKELGRNIALHAAATAPLSLSVEDLDPAAVETRARDFYRTGHRVRQAARRCREDGRGPHPQIL